MQVEEMAAAWLAAQELPTQIVAAREEAQVFAAVLELMMLLEEETRFGSAALLLCHQLAAQLPAQRVSLGMLRGHEVYVEAMSHSERFERKSAAVKALAMAMEEALDQDD